jgi:glycosyltransferase involved in cell wall biosynthesis
LRIIITTRFYKNGQTTHVTDLCAELMRQGHQVLLIMNQLHDPEYARWLRQTKIPYVTASDPRKLTKCVERWLPASHIIHNHSSHTLSTAEALSSLLKIPSITTVHYLGFGSASVLERQDAVIVISREMQKAFEHLTIPTYMVENGVPLPPQHQPMKPWRRNALFLAQATPEKEKNFRSMTESLLAWGWNISSAGNWRHEGITSHGWMNEVGTLLKQTNLVIGTGRAVREAMAWGTPAWVLGTYCDGLITPENITQLEETNFSGRFSKRLFSPNEAALHLKEPSSRDLQALGTFGRKYAQEHYSIQSMVEKILAIYGKCLLKCSGEKQT